MADPITATLMAVGAVVSTFGAIKGAQANNAAATAQANAANMNAQIMNENARLAKINQDNDLAANRRKYNLLFGQTRAQAGALGTFGGTTLDILNDIENQQVFEQKSIVDNYSSQRQNFYNQAAAAKSQAQAANAGKSSVFLAGLTAGIGGATSVASTLKI